VNLDPANDVLPYTPDVDISDLVNLENVMQVCSDRGSWEGSHTYFEHTRVPTLQPHAHVRPAKKGAASRASCCWSWLS
jgi:hypothetical protein